MRLFRSLAVLAALAMPLAACQEFGKITDFAATASNVTVDPTAVIVAANAFDAVEVTAKNYLNLPRCKATSGPLCRDKRATIPLRDAIRSGIKARTAALRFVKDHPEQLGSQGVYDALVAATDVVRSIFATYNIGGAQ